jgi:hypothetical protein
LCIIKLYKEKHKTDYNNRVNEWKVAGWILQELSEQEVCVLKDLKFRDISVTGDNLFDFELTLHQNVLIVFYKEQNNNVSK